MYILTLKGKESEGAYAPTFGNEHILYLFEEEEDAERHCGLLAADDYPDLVPTQVDPDQAISTCEENGYTYCIVTSEDIIIPPNTDD